MNQIWTEDHVGIEFAPTDTAKGKVLAVERLTDVFTYVMASDLDMAMAKDQAKIAEYQKAKDAAA